MSASSRTGITQKSRDESLLPCTLYSVLIKAQKEQFPDSHKTPCAGRGLQQKWGLTRSIQDLEMVLDEAQLE